ncbi:MAG TPA: AraC family transcriptional regulator [Ignavibacteria bacterium]|nr:AraC family transcriptional regulator [Ignavibacteria bacterium]
MNCIIPKYYLFKRIVDAKIYIDKHFKESLSINQLANISCFSKYHFIKLFREVYGITPKQYLIYKRFNEAKELLKSAESVDNICFKVGYSSTNTFTVHFKSITGLSPTGWRKINCSAPKGSFIPRCFLR